MTEAHGRVALLLVDMQADYLDAHGLQPARDEAVANAAAVLELFRRATAPIAHVHTEVQPGGADAMPHRQRLPKCVAGTPGAETPTALHPELGEARFAKQFYSPFSNPALALWLRDERVDTVVVAGAYTHACVRQTAIDAYERGLRVVIAHEACASTQPVHAAESLSWMAERFVTLADRSALAALLQQQATPVELGTVETVVGLAERAQRDWAERSLAERAQAVESWRTRLAGRREELAAAIVRDVAKPISLARAEIDRALAHIDTAVAVCGAGALEPRQLDAGVAELRVPRGVVAAVMPWNNPVALAVSNIAPALLCGNAIVLKPSPLAPESSRLLLDTLLAADLPEGLVAGVPSDLASSRALIGHPCIAAVALTGSIATGREIARVCAERMIPLRAELGGNNAALVWGARDLNAVARDLIGNAFAFAGQRCTAIRRVVVGHTERDDLLTALTQAAADLTFGSPEDPATVCGPVVNRAAADRIRAEISRAEQRGARVLWAATVPAGQAEWVAPTVLLVDDARDPIVQQETFGPVLVVQTADSLDEAIALANGVPHGLVLGVCSDSAAVVDRVVAAAQAGIVHRGAASVPVHALAPFSGWKASGFGGAEHGAWDLEFFTRPQARYGLGA